MDPNNTEKDIDQLLDSVLGQYGKAEPRAGLEMRVLANLRAEKDRLVSRRRWWWAAGMATVAASIAIAIWLGHSDHAGIHAGVTTTTAKNDASGVDRPTLHPEIRPAPQLPVTQQAKEAVQRRPTRRESPNPQVTEAAKLEQFPTPAPLSDQEKLLARYVQEFPQKAVLMAKIETDLRKQNELEMAAPWPRNADSRVLEQQE